MSQTREKWVSLVLSRGDFWMIWRCHSIPCFHFYFLFRNNGVREQLDKNEFSRCYGNFVFSKVSFRKYLITVMFKALSRQLWATLTTVFEWHLTIEGFKGMDQHWCWAYTKTFDRFTATKCYFLFFIKQ